MVTTGGRNDAERLGEALVVEHLAACCSVVPTVHSVYYWEGQLKREHEALLLVKTVESRAAACRTTACRLTACRTTAGRGGARTTLCRARRSPAACAGSIG